MGVRKRRSRWCFKTALASLGVASLIPLLAAPLAAPAYAWSADTYSKHIGPGSDYMESREWMGWGDPFNASSSSWLWGSSPYDAYHIQDLDTLQVNGIGVSIGAGGGGITCCGGNIETLTADRYYRWEADNTAYNVASDCSWCWINWTGTDRTMVILWANTSPYWNHATATKWA